MSSIYKAWLMNLQPAWYGLDKSAQDELRGKMSDNLGKVGGKMLLFASTLWADEKWFAWGIEEYPNIEAVMHRAKAIGELNWFRYTNTWTTLGTSWEPEAKVVVPEAPVYRVAFFKPTAEGFLASKEVKDSWNQKHEAIFKEFGVKTVLGCDGSWCNEEWPFWSVEAYPSIEAVQGMRMKTFEAGWYQYMTATSWLGVKLTMA